MKLTETQKGFSLILIALAVLTVLTIAAIGYYLYFQSSEEVILQKKQARREAFFSSQGRSVADVSRETKSTLPKSFYAYIEYNPQAGIVREIKSGASEAETFLSQEEPKDNSQMFDFKIVVQNNGVTAQEGWQRLPIEMIKTNEGNYKFHIYTNYQQGASIELFTRDNKSIWKSVIL